MNNIHKDEPFHPQSLDGCALTLQTKKEKNILTKFKTDFYLF